jgi:predicted Rossmann fold nucleotide-binding protein DprA/Smf involved in DNA uptake
LRDHRSPPVLWIRGDGALDGLCVAIVGSRAGSPCALAAASAWRLISPPAG